MKKLLVILPILFLFLFASFLKIFASESQLDLNDKTTNGNNLTNNSPAFLNDPNLLAYYKLESTSDSKGSNTLTNNSSVAFNAAKYNNGGDLGTSNSTKYFQTSNDLGLGGNGSFTFSFWVKLQTEISSGTYHLFEHGSTTQNMILRVRYEYNGGTRRLAFSRGKPGVSDDAEYYNVNLGTSSWHHVVFAYDGTTIKGYLDGTEVVSASKSGTGVSLPTAGFTIGANNDDGNLASAIFDDFAIFNRNISSSEVSRIYNSTVDFGSIGDSPFTASSKSIALDSAFSQYLSTSDSSSLSITGTISIEQWVNSIVYLPQETSMHLQRNGMTQDPIIGHMVYGYIIMEERILFYGDTQQMVPIKLPIR